jgi:hypothetical protein
MVLAASLKAHSCKSQKLGGCSCSVKSAKLHRQRPSSAAGDDAATGADDFEVDAVVDDDADDDAEHADADAEEAARVASRTR